jgi:hypothetical protein
LNGGQINAHLHGEKNKDKVRQVAMGNVDNIVSLFIHSAPKFITPAPDLEDLRSGRVISAPYGGIQVSLSTTHSPAAGVDPSDVSCVSCQGAVFRDEVTQMLDLVDLRSYIRLYSSITIQKVPHPHVKLSYSTALQTFPFSLPGGLLALILSMCLCVFCVCSCSCLPSRSSRTTAAASLRTTARPLTPSAATSSSSSTSCS